MSTPDAMTTESEATTDAPTTTDAPNGSGGGVESTWGRIDANGTAYVRLADGSERIIGAWASDSLAAGLEFFQRRYADLATQVSLIEQRLASGKLAPEQAEKSIAGARANVESANAIGDLASLLARLDALTPQVAEARTRAAESRKAQQAAVREAKEAIVAEAEEIAKGTDFKRGADRMRELLDAWKAAGRLDRASDDALWHRFSGARTEFTKARKIHFDALNAQRDAARAAKEAIVAEAESLAQSTAWRETGQAMRGLMDRWKAAGRAPREVEDQLWARFRGAQDAFYEARGKAMAAKDSEFAAILAAKEAVVTKAEALLPITDVTAARQAWRDLAEQFEVAGRLPRAIAESVEQRFRAVNDAIARAGQDEWRRSNPEAKARAAGIAAQLQELLNDLEAKAAAARARGDESTAARLESDIRARREWLSAAETTLAEFR